MYSFDERSVRSAAMEVLAALRGGYRQIVCTHIWEAVLQAQSMPLTPIPRIPSLELSKLLFKEAVYLALGSSLLDMDPILQEKNLKIGEWFQRQLMAEMTSQDPHAKYLKRRVVCIFALDKRLWVWLFFV